MRATESESPVGRYCRRLTDAASLAAVVLGGLVLAGWAWNIGLLLSVLPGHATMKPNTAACFVFSGLALWLLRSSTIHSSSPDARRVTGRILAALVALIGFSTGAQDLLDVDLGIDWLLFPDRLRATSLAHPGRISFATAASFFLLGVALFSMDAGSARIRRVFPPLVLLVGTVSLIPMLGYLYDASALYRGFPYQSIALHTSLTFIVLSVGALCARPDLGVATAITSDLMGGMMARRLLPFVVGLPIILGWTGLTGERTG